MNYAAKQGEPWFEDGNIILVTDECEGGELPELEPSTAMMFKVHRGVLARHSDMFQGMFELSGSNPNSSHRDSQTIQGCPFVRLYDLPSELSNLIKALYDGATFSNSSPNDFFYLAGILRLSTKYLIQHLRTAAIKALICTWPDTLQGHDAMVDLALKAPVIDALTFPYIHPQLVLNLARENSVSIVVPAAIYFLSLYPVEGLLLGNHPKLLIDHPSKPSSKMDPEDLKHFALMFQRRMDLILDFVRKTCGERIPSSPTCLSPPTCTRSFQRLTSRLSRSWMTRTGPLHFMQSAINEVTNDPTFCRPCQVNFRIDVTAIREVAWNDLPAVVGLPSWEVLRTDI